MKELRRSLFAMSTIIGISTVVVLAGCGINNQAQNELSPIENTGAFRYVNDRGFNDQQMVRQVNDLNGTNFPQGSYGYNDYNYHGHLNTTYNGIPTRSYHSGYDNVIAQKITDRIEHVANVNDVAAIIDGDTIVVVIDTDEKNQQKIENKVYRIVEGMAPGRNIKVITDKSMFNK